MRSNYRTKFFQIKKKRSYYRHVKLCNLKVKPRVIGFFYEKTKVDLRTSKQKNL